MSARPIYAADTLPMLGLLGAIAAQAADDLAEGVRKGVIDRAALALGLPCLSSDKRLSQRGASRGRGLTQEDVQEALHFLSSDDSQVICHLLRLLCPSSVITPRFLRRHALRSASDAQRRNNASRSYHLDAERQSC